MTKRRVTPGCSSFGLLAALAQPMEANFRFEADIRRSRSQCLLLGIEGTIMARRAVPHHWLVSVKVPRRGRGALARVTKTFATEAEAKAICANEMLSESNTIYAGT